MLVIIVRGSTSSAARRGGLKRATRYMIRWRSLADADHADAPRISFALYLVALALLPFRWLSPFSYEQAGWTDILMAAAVTAWLAESAFGRRRPSLRAPHALLGTYLLAVALSGAVSGDRSTAVRNVLITAEVIAIAVLSSDFARSPNARRAIARVIFAVSMVTAAEAVAGLVLFYLGVKTSLVNGYSTYFSSSHLYTRVQAGFYSPPLLGSFCVFASAVLATAGTGIPRRALRVAQVVLALLAVSTLSRPAIAFGIGMAVREAHRRGTVQARRLALACVVTGCTALALLSVAPLSLDPLRPSSSQSAINPRLAMLKSAFSSLEKRPLLGRGPGSLAARWQGQPLRAHFTPLNIAATTGLISLIALTGFVVVVWRRRRRPTNVALWSGLLALGIDGLTQDVEHFRHVWILLGMADADRGDSAG